MRNHRDSGAFGRAGTEKSGDFGDRRANVPANRLPGNPRPNGRAVKPAPSSLTVTMDSNFEGSRWEKLEVSPLGDRDCEGCVQLITPTSALTDEIAIINHLLQEADAVTFPAYKFSLITVTSEGSEAGDQMDNNLLKIRISSRKDKIMRE